CNSAMDENEVPQPAPQFLDAALACGAERRLEMQHNSSRRLRRVSRYMRRQNRNPEVRAVVDKSAVLQSKSELAEDPVVHAAAVHKCRAGLSLLPRNESSHMAGGTK